MRLKERFTSFATKLRSQSGNRSGKSDPATPICKCCFKDIRPYSFATLLSEGDEAICPKCFQMFKPDFRHFKLDGFTCFSLYPYSEAFRSRLYALKGEKDLEMAPVFLAYQNAFLKAMFNGYKIVPAPSFHAHDEERGYNHVEAIFKTLGLPILKVLRKTEDVKQAGRSLEDRMRIGESLALEKGPTLKGEKILFVDDVMTTGSTAKACLKLLKEQGPKRLKALFLAKTEKKEESLDPIGGKPNG